MTSPGITTFARLAALTALCLTLPVRAETLTVAVASNFINPMRALVQKFEETDAAEVRLVPGSSGKLYAQIMSGAPFDAFFSADQIKPAALEQAGKGHDRFTYAVGQLALWSADPTLVEDGRGLLASGNFTRLSIANPKLAPYGLAAVETLAHLDLDLTDKYVMGENIGQTYQFVASGNAQVGFVALSQINHGNGSSWRVPAHMHNPIRQDAVSLHPEHPAVRRFMAFTRNAAPLLAEFGYLQPEAP